MSLLVQKFGGTSVGSVERIRQVADKVARFRAGGHDLVVVVSAMSGETNRLIALAHEVQASPDPREMDVMVSTGEQVSIALLSMADFSSNTTAWLPNARPKPTYMVAGSIKISSSRPPAAMSATLS